MIMQIANTGAVDLRDTHTSHSEAMDDIHELPSRAA